MKYPKEINPVHISTPAQWREWLSENHDKKDYIWLALKKKHSFKTGILYLEALEEAICFGWIDSQMKGCDDDFFIQRFSPRKKNSKWSLLNKKRVLKMIEEGKMTDAGLEKINEAKENGQWQKAYFTPKNVEIPSDLILFLKKCDAWEAFCNLSNSHRNIYVLWLNDTKKEETREKRMEGIVKRILG